MSITEKEALARIRSILELAEAGQEPEPVEPDPFDMEDDPSRFSGPFAPWNIPAASIGTHNLNGRHRAELLKCCDGKVNTNTAFWSPSIYYFDDSTPRVNSITMKRPNWGNLPPNEPLPWEPSWKVTPDDDAYAVLIEKGTGRCYIVWQTDYHRNGNVMHCGTAYEHQTTTWMKRTQPGNVWEKENGSLSDRACGLPYPALLGMRAEMEAGRIKHALGLAIPSPTRGAKVAPAVKGAGPMGGPANRSAMGRRFVWDLPGKMIDSWANQFDGEMRKHMKTIAVCIRDYGVIITDHGGNEGRKIGSTQLEGDPSAKWSEIGLDTRRAQGALHSLLAPNAHLLRCLEEPEFPGGNMNRVAVYNGVDYPEGYRD